MSSAGIGRSLQQAAAATYRGLLRGRLSCYSADRHSCVLEKCPFPSANANLSTGSSAKELHDSDVAEFPGGKVTASSTIKFAGGPGTTLERLPCYRALHSTGTPLEEAIIPHPIGPDLALKMHSTMVQLQVLDLIFYEAQRQGRFSFYMTSNGEEATVVASAAALDDTDEVFAQYREQGALLWRGYTVQQLANQCFGNHLDSGKGRQMPVHYGSADLNFHTISSPLGTQLLHAVGAGYTLKLQEENRLSVAYFGDGAASEGDFHAALNFAATLDVPMLFICRNNGWAISTPAEEQYRGDGIGARGPAYGISTVRVDGSDGLAVYNAVKEARALAMTKRCPVLIECMSYRSGHHSTSDDSSRYRTTEEMERWKARDPVIRFQYWMQHCGWWNEEKEQRLRQAMRKKVLDALDEAEALGKPPLSDMFTDVYDTPPWNLEEQKQNILQHLEDHPEDMPFDMKMDLDV